MTGLSLKYYRWIIACRVQSARECRKMTVQELARRADISNARLTNAERGAVSLTVDEVERIALVLRLPSAHFMGMCILCGSPD